MPNCFPFGRRMAALALLFSLFAPGRAKAADSPQAAAPPPKPACAVITVAPGDGLDALFGHTAIRIQDPRLEAVFGAADVWFDYGVFDPTDHKTGEITVWSASQFVVHYAKGDAKYLLVAADPRSRLAEYEKEGRAVTEQALDLKPAEVAKLEDYLLENLRHPEYEYRFLDDNCTTRAKGAIEAATEKAIRTKPLGNFRDKTDCYLGRRPWVRLGANLLMGVHADSQASIFLPDMLSFSLKGHQAVRPDDEEKSEVLPIGRLLEIMADSTFWIISLTTLFLAIPTFYRHRKKIPLPRRAYLDALLFAVAGLIGGLMTFLGFWSLHPELGAFNWNLIWCWPTHLIFSFFFLFAAGGKTLRLYARITCVGASCAALAYFFVPQALPVPLFPLVLLLAVRAWRWGWSGTPESKTKH